ncbi:unnamed protein product [Ectocarpus fasciculatus]
MLRRGMVHPCDDDGWRPAFFIDVDVDGGGYGQLVMSATDETRRVILCRASLGRMSTLSASRHLSLVRLQQARAGVTPEPSLETAQNPRVL